MMADDLNTVLQTLEQAQLLRQVTDPEMAYVFKHVLAQEAAYSSLLARRRRDLHRSVAQAYEVLYANRLDDFAGLLAQHWAAAGDDKRTLLYARQAADSAAGTYAYAEALAYYDLCLEAARREADGRQLEELYLKRGRVLELSSRHRDAMANYQEMEALAEERNDHSLRLAALMARATLHSTLTRVYDPQQGRALSEAALALARELGDQAAEAKSLWNLMLLHTFIGQPDRGVIYGQQSLAIARRDPTSLRDQLAYTLTDLSRALLAVGQPDQGRVMLAEAQQIWHEAGNLPMLAESHSILATYHYFGGRPRQAVQEAEEANRISESIGNLWGQSYSRETASYGYLELGEPSKAIAGLEAAQYLGRQAGFLEIVVGVTPLIAVICGSLGAVERGLALIHQAQAEVDPLRIDQGQWVYAIAAVLHLAAGNLVEAELALRHDLNGSAPGQYVTPVPFLLRLARAELALARGEYARAQEMADELTHGMRRAQVRVFLPDVLFLKARALQSEERLGEAWLSFEEAKAEAQLQESRRSLWPILAAMSSLAAQLGQSGLAEDLRRQGQEVVMYIAGHTDGDLRGTFLRLAAQHGLAPAGIDMLSGGDHAEAEG